MISIIIPTYNETQSIRPCLERLKGEELEIILADSPDSNEGLKKLATEYGFGYLKTKRSGRNHQMNEGAAVAQGDILYFVHADVLLNKDFKSDIEKAIRNGYDMGCYRSKYDQYLNPLLYINAFFTRFPMIWCRGGDQTLFIKKEAFEALDGFSDEHRIMEDYDILIRSKGKYRFKIIPKSVIISARKYQNNSYWNVLKANYLVMSKWLKKDAKPEELYQTYKRLLKP